MTPTSIERALQTAVEHHQFGRLTEAESLYREVLGECPENADALHLLGVLACQTGHIDHAVALIGQAIRLKPHVGQFHGNLGECYRRSGEWERALGSLNQAVTLTPDLVAAHHSMGLVLKEQGRLAEAITAFRRAIEHGPHLFEPLKHLGDALRDLGRVDEAIAAYHRAAGIQPGDCEVHTNLGDALRQQGRIDEAIDCYSQAARLSPDLAETHNNLGFALGRAGRLDEAIAAYRRALILKPGLAEAHNNLGNALSELGRLDEAIAAYRRAIELRPDLAEIHNNLGAAMQLTTRLDEAIAAYARSIALQPGNADVHANLGNAFRAEGRLDDALACYRRAMELDPDSSAIGSNYLFSLHLHPGYDAQAILAEHLRWARQHAEPLSAQMLPHDNDRSPDRRLRIGYLSPDFREHPVGRCFRPLLGRHDRRRFEIFCYSDARRADGVTGQLQALADRWYDTATWSDERLADQIRDDRIDILVDLALHTPDNRLPVFARRPAPVQVTTIGLPSTTGLRTIDYRLTDPYLDPPGSGDCDYTERSIRLPHSYLCHDYSGVTLPVGEVPATRNGFITFGCLNQFAKVSHDTLGLWIEILQRLPRSRLVIKSPSEGRRAALCKRFRAEGIGLDRIDFLGTVSAFSYFSHYHGLDFCLDPFPYSGYTTSVDAIWMGVPVVTLAGRTGVGRGGVSVLSNLGLPELIARTSEEYVEIAIRWAEDRPALAALRAGLRQRLLDSPLMDAAGYAAAVEDAYRAMWEAWCGRS
jgi:predicted O-linked N-acetylglucosamine transferase (SPINDLY family)